MTSNGFQSAIYQQPTIGKAGDFAGANFRAVVIGGPGQLVAAPPPRRPIIGNFAWADQVGGLVYGQYPGISTCKIGFIHNDDQTVVQSFLSATQSAIEAGQPVTPFEQGTFRANLPLGATVGQKVFANYADGSPYAAAAGTSTTAASVTGSIAATTGVLTVSAVGSGTLVSGQFLTGTNLPAGTILGTQLTGTVGGVGTYSTSYTGSGAIASGTLTAATSIETNFYVDTAAYQSAIFTGYIAGTGTTGIGTLTVSATTSGTIAVGQQLVSASGQPTGMTILSGSGSSWQVSGYYGEPIGSSGTPVTFTGFLGSLAIISSWG